MDSANLQDLFLQLDNFAAGRTDLATLRRWFLPFHTAPVSPPDDGIDEESHSPQSWSADDFYNALFWQLVWLFEGDATEERHRDLAQRLAACYSELGDPAIVLDVFPLIVARERFCSIIAKHRAGIVSRVGLISVIGKTFRWDPGLREWLTAASVQNIEVLCSLLEANDYSAAVTRLNLPPA